MAMPALKTAGIDERTSNLRVRLERYRFISVHARRHHVRGQIDGFANPLHGSVGHHELSAVSRVIAAEADFVKVAAAVVERGIDGVPDVLRGAAAAVVPSDPRA